MSFSGKVGHLEDIGSPWANAGGVVKSLEEVVNIAQTAVGWIEAGSYTLEPRQGNGWDEETQTFDYAKVYYHNPETGETFNSLGMPNLGLDVVEAEIPDMANIARTYKKPLLVNVAPVSDQPVLETLEMVIRAYTAGADGVILNAGCPNVVTEDGGRHEILSRSPAEFGKVLSSLAEVALTKPIWVRISPQENYASISAIADHIRNSGIVSAVLTPNTWPDHKPVKPNGQYALDVPGNSGGLSGPATAEAAYKQTEWAFRTLWRRVKGVDVISSGGIMNAAELKRRLDTGAVAAAGTTFFYEAKNGWNYEVDKLLTDFVYSSK